MHIPCAESYAGFCVHGKCEIKYNMATCRSVSYLSWLLLSFLLSRSRAAGRSLTGETPHCLDRAWSGLIICMSCVCHKWKGRNILFIIEMEHCDIVQLSFFFHRLLAMAPTGVTRATRGHSARSPRTSTSCMWCPAARSSTTSSSPPSLAPYRSPSSLPWWCASWGKRLGVATLTEGVTFRSSTLSSSSATERIENNPRREVCTPLQPRKPTVCVTDEGLNLGLRRGTGLLVRWAKA